MPRIDIDSLSHDGRGLTRIDGKVAFIDGALPGETVDAELRRRHRRYDEYRLIRVVTSSPDRVTPLCPLVGTCGGCDLQHLGSDAELRHKTEVLLEMLERQAGLVPEQLAEPLRSEPFGYRRRARLAVWVPRRGGRPLLGFREAGGNRVVGLAHCPVLAAPLTDLPGPLQQVVADLQRPAALGHVELSLSESSDETLRAVIHIHAAAALAERDQAAFAELAAARGAYLSLQSPGLPLVYLHQPDPLPPGYLLPEFSLRLGYQPGDFLQGNVAVNRRLVGRVVEWLDDCPAQRVLDAFAGVGNFSLPLARRGFEVLGLEVVPQMVDRARRNAQSNDVPSAAFRIRDLTAEPVDPGREDFQAAVLDPPRAGARALIGALAARRPATIVYVSCSPPSLARDAAALAASGYRLARLGLVDMFPQTSHIESIALFVRR